MAQKVVIDPITRIEGHLKIEVEVEGGKVVDARASGTMWRGIEVILQGRDPRDAAVITQRICGVCPAEHALASVQSLDMAFGAEVPDNGRIIRNLVAGANYIQSHMLHFYHLAALDYIDIMAVAKYQGTDPELTPTPDRIASFRSMLLELIDFINNVYLQDIVYLGTGPLKPLHDAKVGAGYGNFLSYGMFDLGRSGDYRNRYVKAGVIYNGELDKVEEFDPSHIKEYVKHSWYADETTGKHPSAGATVPDPNKEDGYSWVKAPRYKDKPMEVGPLARQLVTKNKGFMDFLGKLGAWPSAVARHAARAYECKLVAEGMLEWLEELNPEQPVCAEKPVPAKATGVGLVEAARGALGHFIEVEDGKIKNYQCVVPTTWNCSPRDDKGVRGPVEEALIGAPVPDPDNPINVVRIVRSFDPCMACAVHLIHPETNEIIKFRVV